MLNKILVAVDCSKNSETVLKALENLNLSPASQVIFSSILPSPESSHNLPADKPKNNNQSFEQKRKEDLEKYQRQYPNSVVEISRGEPGDEIIRLANIYRVDLIVMGTRGLKGFERILENSVSSQVVAEAKCSVLVVKN